MAAEHAQLLASLAVAQVRPEQPEDAVGIRTEVVPVEELHAEDAGHENETDSVRVAEELQGSVPTVIYGNLRKKRKVLIEDSPRHSDFKVVPPKERSNSSKMEMRRPVRPIDRQKMRPWLKNLLDKGSVFGLNWTKREEGVFQISWRHASRLGWNLETDGDVFERWARHTGIYKDGDVPEPKRWKANFRCALHSLPDVKELTSPDDRKGRNASRTYRFLTPNEIQPPVKRKHRYSIQIPYLYEHPNSEDSGSQNSDERNSDEEVSDGQPRQVPHCDHDYAARVDKVDAGGLTTSAIFQRHGSGYVLIKSKDAHEYEFRLTSSGEASAEPKQQQLKSPPKKSPVKKRKPPASKSSPPASSPSKRSKGKDSLKGVAKPKGGKKLAKKRKKVVSSGEKRNLPGGKPTLQALLAGRQVNKNTKRPRPSRSPAAAAKKTRAGKAGEATGKGVGKGSGGESGQGTPTQRQGLDACMLLLEAATQLDKMDSLSSSETSTTSTKPASSSRPPPKTAAPVTQAKVSTTTTSPATVTTAVAAEAGGGVSTPPPASVATVFVPAVSSSAPGTLGAVFSVPQAPPGMLQQYIGLAAESSASKTPALSSLLSVTTHASTAGVVLPATQLLAHPFKVVGFINSIEPALGTVPQSTKETAVAPTFVASVPMIPTAVTMAAPVHAQAATPPIIGQPASSLGAGTSMLKHLLRLTCPPPKPMPVTITTASAPSTTQQTASVNILPFTAPVVSASASDGGDGTTTVLVKEEQVSFPVEENSDMQGKGDQTKDSYEIVAEVDLGASQEDTWEEKGVNSLPYLRVSSSKKMVKQEQDADSLDAETVNSQAQTDTETGDNVQDSFAQPTASVDSIMQFLNLISANSNSSVVVKTETPVTGVPDDVIAINSAYNNPAKTEPQGAAASQQTDSQEFMNRLNQLTVPPDWAGEGVGETSVAVSGLEGVDPEKNGSQDSDGEQADTGIELHVQQGDSDDEMPVLTKEEPLELS